VNDNYDKEWIEQRLYAIDRELAEEQHLMSSKSFDKLIAESDKLNDELSRIKALEIRNKSSFQDDKSKNSKAAFDKFIKRVKAQTDKELFNETSKNITKRTVKSFEEKLGDYSSQDIKNAWDMVMIALFSNRVKNGYTEKDKNLDDKLDILQHIVMKEALRRS
tara:strand:+ start:1182 stop:1670 length:489 start_codon:yes stop_codon:yes gene_type:complete